MPGMSQPVEGRCQVNWPAGRPSPIPCHTGVPIAPSETATEKRDSSKHMTSEVAPDGWSDFQVAEPWTEPAGQPAAGLSQSVSEACRIRHNAAQFVQRFFISWGSGLKVTHAI